MDEKMLSARVNYSYNHEDFDLIQNVICRSKSDRNLSIQLASRLIRSDTSLTRFKLRMDDKSSTSSL